MGPISATPTVPEYDLYADLFEQIGAAREMLKEMDAVVPTLTDIEHDERFSDYAHPAIALGMLLDGIHDRLAHILERPCGAAPDDQACCLSEAIRSLSREVYGAYPLALPNHTPIAASAN